MPRSWAVFVVSLILQIVGGLWMLLSILLLFTTVVSAGDVPAVEQLPAPPPSLTMPLFPSGAEFRQAAVGTFLALALLAFLANVFIGLCMIATGQLLLLFVYMVENTHRTARSSGGRDTSLDADMSAFRRRVQQRTGAEYEDDYAPRR